MSGFQTRMEGWTMGQHALLLTFYASVVLGILSFLAFDIGFLAGISKGGGWMGDSRDFVALLGIGFLFSLQAGWCYLAWHIHCRERPLKAVSIAIFPLLLTSLPFGAIAYSEWTNAPSHLAPVV